MKIIHFCAGLEGWNGMANTAKQFVKEELAAGHESQLTNDIGVIERQEDVDRIQIHGTWLPVLWKVSKLAKKKGAELVVRPCGNYDPIRIRRGFLKRIKKLSVTPWEHAMLKRADFVQCTCKAEAEWVKAFCRGARIQMTDLKRFFELNRAPVARDKPRDQATLRILFLGRAEDPLKGVRYLDRAVRELAAAGSLGRGVDLRIVSNHFGEELEMDWQWCDVLCLPTLSENFGRVVAEALERGKRVITTDGAPAWEPPRVEAKDQGDGELWWNRLSYLRGYRKGNDSLRIKLLKDAIMSL